MTAYVLRVFLLVAPLKKNSLIKANEESSVGMNETKMLWYI